MNSKKILIVDDEPDILEFLSYNFREKKFAVTVANNGLEGIIVAEKESPDLIISDILMPGMNGIEMCLAIRRKKKFRKIPLLFLTAVNDDYKVLHAMMSGANQFVSKPIKFDYLLAIVNQLLKEQIV